MQNVNLNLIPGSVLPVINVSQYDKGRHFTLTVYEGAASYSLTGKDVQIRGTKPDGNGFAYDAQDGVVSVSGNTVTISTTQQMTAVGGQTMAELRIKSGTTILGTINFILDVEHSALSDDTPISETEIPVIERDFAEALEEAQEAAETATTKAGEASTSATSAAGSATSAAADALKAEGYAVGKQNGSPVGSGSPYYQNNAEYYDTHASEQAYNASQSATAAGNSATAAAGDSLEAEGFAVGEQNGTPVGPDSPYYHNNAAYYAQEAGQHASGGIIFKGSLAFADLPTVGMASGDEYNITDDFTTDSRFIEGAGHSVKAGTNIAWVAGNVNKWDILATGGGSGVPAGGTTDQVLAKNSNTDGDTKWMNVVMPGDIAPTESTSTSSKAYAVGDLLYYEGVLYKVTTSIAQGDSIVTSGSGQNVEVTTVDGEFGTRDAELAAMQEAGAVNWLNNTAISQVLSGVTFTVNADKSVTLSGESTEATGIVFGFVERDVSALIGKQVKASLKIPSDMNSAYYGNIRFLNSSDAVIFQANVNNTTEQVAYTVPSGTAKIRLSLLVNAGKTVSGTVYPMIYDARLIDPPYQPYAMTNRELTDAVSSGYKLISACTNVASVTADGVKTWSELLADLRAVFAGVTMSNGNNYYMPMLLERQGHGYFTPLLRFMYNKTSAGTVNITFVMSTINSTAATTAIVGMRPSDIYRSATIGSTYTYVDNTNNVAASGAKLILYADIYQRVSD